MHEVRNEPLAGTGISHPAKPELRYTYGASRLRSPLMSSRTRMAVAVALQREREEQERAEAPPVRA